MNGDNENSKTNKPNDVSTGKTAWIICKSKSHPGLNYYFNYVTRESTWQLSETEKAKAQWSKILSSTELEKCSEPNVPPEELTALPSRIYNKQIINNQFPNHLPEMYMPNTPNNSSFNQQIWQAPPNTGLMPGQPYFLFPGTIVPSIAPFINQPSVNYGTRPSLEYSRNSHIKHSNTRGTRGHSNIGRYRTRGHFVNKRNQIRPDLRQKLVTSRTNSLSYDSWEEENTNTQYQQTKTDTREQDPVNYSDDFLHETPSKYNLSNVKQLNSPESKRSNWLIVVDIHILVNEFKFLNRFTDPEQSCYLLVPDHVMCELKARATNGCDKNVKRIYRFLSECMESELAFKGNDVSKRAAETNCDKTIVTCLDYTEENNVILLSNDTKFHKYKENDYNIHVFTMSELKYILDFGPLKQKVTTKMPNIRHIKITVTNDTKDESNPIEPFLPSLARPHMKSNNVQAPVSTTSNTEISIDSPQPSISKCEIKSSVQIENTLESTEQSDSKGAVTPEPKQVERVLSTPKSSTREIKLNRDSLNKNTNGESTMRSIQLRRRWRLKRPTKTQENLPNLSSTKQDVDSNKDNIDELTPLADKFINMECNASNNLPKSTIARTPSTNSSVSSPSKNIGPIKINEDSTSSASTHINNVSIHNQVKERKFKMRTAVMFEVDAENMEEVLRTRRDEWVTRFVQIMEEVLRLKLQDSSALHLHEAVRCMIQKFSSNFSVVDAANRLSFVLFQIRDDTGNIKANIEPSEYMEMYSYGVYLIETLKDMSENCEDLKVADASLKKLLHDINNSNFDSQNDSFIEGRNEGEMNATEAAIDEEMAQQMDISVSNKDIDKGSENSTENYRLHSQNINTEQNEPQKTPTSNESSFFSSLQLKKRFQKTIHTQPLDTQDSFDNANDFNTDDQYNTSLSPKSPQSPPNTYTEVQKAMNADNDTSVVATVDKVHNKNTSSVTVQPTIARNFVNLPQFEEILKRKANIYQNVRPHESCYTLAYPKGIYDKEEKGDYDENIDDYSTEKKDDMEKISDDETTTVNDDNFKSFIREFVGEIREVFQKMVVLCYNIARDDWNANVNNIDEAKKASVLLSSISQSLESILDREIRDPEKNLVHLLKNAHLENFVPRKSLLSQYVDIITKCKNQADCLYETITVILEVKEGRIKVGV